MTMSAAEKRAFFEAKDRVFAQRQRDAAWPAQTCADCRRRGYQGPAGTSACCTSFGHHLGDCCVHCGNDERELVSPRVQR